MARQLTANIWLFDLGLVEPFETSCYFVVDPTDDTCTLVDIGLPINRPTLASELADAGYTPDAIDRVLLTHYDIDHVGGVRALREFDVPIYLGERDVALVRGEWNPPWPHHKGLFHRIARRLFPLRGIDLRPVADGDRIGGFTAHHTPGHNPGHTVYTHAGLETAFLGDLVWGAEGSYTTPFWLDSYEMRAVRESVRAFAEDVEFERGLMAHGEPVLEQGAEQLRALADSFI